MEMLQQHANNTFKFKLKIDTSSVCIFDCLTCNVINLPYVYVILNFEKPVNFVFFFFLIFVLAIQMLGKNLLF